LFWAYSLYSLAILCSSTVATRILASDSIIGLMGEGVAVADNGVVKVGCPDRFTY
jgi:hypothetical protein